MLSHKNIIANMLQITAFEGEAFKATPTKPRGTILFPLPFYHIYGMVFGLCVGTYNGGRLIFMPAFDLAQYLSLVQDYRVTRSFVVPPIVLALAKHPLVEQFDLSSLESIMSGAAPLGGDVSACRGQERVQRSFEPSPTHPRTHVCPQCCIVWFGLCGKSSCHCQYQALLRAHLCSHPLNYPFTHSYHHA